MRDVVLGLCWTGFIRNVEWSHADQAFCRAERAVGIRMTYGVRSQPGDGLIGLKTRTTCLVHGQTFVSDIWWYNSNHCHIRGYLFFIVFFNDSGSLLTSERLFSVVQRCQECHGWRWASNSTIRDEFWTSSAVQYRTHRIWAKPDRRHEDLADIENFSSGILSRLCRLCCHCSMFVSIHVQRRLPLPCCLRLSACTVVLKDVREIALQIHPSTVVNH